MNICKSDIYFIILLALFVIVFYKIFKLENIKEGFDATSDMKAVINQVYNADIEAIRNLSSIATQLTTNNTLTMPGALNITNELSVKTGDPGKQVKIGSSQIKFRGDGIVHYGLTNDKDGKFKISNLSGSADIGSGFVNDCITTDSIGNTTINGNLNMQTVKPIIDLGAGDTTREPNAGKIGYNIFEDSLNIVGKGKPGEARRITMWDQLKINGTFCIGGTCIDESRLKMLTDGVKIQTTGNGWFPNRWIHTHGDGIMRQADDQYRTTYKLYPSTT
jgi:hypothetical protein